MTRNSFGWSYPPGAENDPLAPWNQDDGVTQLQCDILELLERAGIPTKFCDDIMQLIACGEQARQDHDDAEMVQQLADQHQEYLEERQPLNEAEGDEYAEAYLRWTESTR